MDYHDNVVAAAEGERRHEQRHGITRPCRVQPVTAPDMVMTAVTANVSRSGILIRFPQSTSLHILPKMGECVRIEIDLPPSSYYDPRSLECSGRVVRDSLMSEGQPTLAFELHSMRVLSRLETDTPSEQDKFGSVQ